MQQRIWRAWLVICLLCGFFAINMSGTTYAAGCTTPISLSAAAYVQDFDTLSNSATATALTIAGWCLDENGTSATNNDLYVGSTGSSGTGDTYSFGAAADSERALGSLLSSSLTPMFGVSFVNNTGDIISGFNISYRGEEWRLGTTARTDRLDFQYSLDATSLATGTWTDFDSLDFTTPDTGTAGAKDGNTVDADLAGTVTGLSLGIGSEFSIRWTDFNASGADDGLAVDDFSITPILAGPDLIPPLVNIVPANGATNVADDTNITVTFSESVTAPASAFLIECPTPGNTQAFALSGGPAIFTLNPNAALPANVVCTVTIDATQVTDGGGNQLDGNADGTGGDNAVSTFTAIADIIPPTAIHTPTSGATNISTGTNITVTFSEGVTAPASAFLIQCPIPGNTQAFALSGGPAIFTLNPSANLPVGAVCTVTVDAAQVSDAAGNLLDGDSNGTGGGNHVFAFTTAPLVRIRDIQGARHFSPFIGATEVGVVDVPGIVTAKRSNGFYIQDPDLSGDTTGIASSEAIFVFTTTSGAGAAIRDSVTVGDAVLVSGAVSEFRPGINCSVRKTSDLSFCSGTDAPGLSITELSARTGVQELVVTAWACTGVCTITPTTIGTGGRIPPNQVLNAEAANIDTGGTFNAATDGIDFYESLEGMRVTLNAGLRVVGPTAGFTSGTEIWVVADQFANSNNTPNPRGGLTISPTDYYNPERIRVSTKADTPFPMGAVLPNLNVGATVDAPINGVVDYSFNNFEIISLNSSYTTTQSTITKEVTSFVSSGPEQLTVATFNVQNLGGNAATTDFDARANVIVNNLKSPDIIVLEEMQDNDGTGTGGQAANITFTKLITAITTAGGPTYDYRQIDPCPGNTDGGVGNGNIRVGFLFRVDRGITFVSRVAGDFDDALSITCSAGVPTPNLNPGRIDPTNIAFENSRKPTVGEFVFNGQTFFIIGNHWNSKGGDNPVFGSTMPPVELSRTQRTQQATVVRNFVKTILSCKPTANVIVAGDLNDYQFSPPVTLLLGTTPALIVMNTSLPINERYGYVYQGTSQSLDHIVVSPNIVTKWAAQYDSVHVNSEFYDQVSDHDPSLIILTAVDLQEKPLQNVFTTSTPTLTWSRLTWAASYEIVVDEVSNFSSPTTFTTSGISLLLPSLPDGVYFWRVRGKDTGNVFGANSTTDTFVIDTTP